MSERSPNAEVSAGGNAGAKVGASAGGNASAHDGVKGGANAGANTSAKASGPGGLANYQPVDTLYLWHLAQPLQRELCAVGELGPPDEPLEQAQPRRQQLAVVAGTGFDLDADARDARVRSGPLALSRGPWRADGQQRGGRGWH